MFAYAGNFTQTMEWNATITTLIRFENGAIGKVGCVLEGNLKYQFGAEISAREGRPVSLPLPS